MTKPKTGQLASILESVEKARAEIERATKKLSRDNRSMLMREFFESFFEKYPAVTAIRWTQYTPGFNDGEPCIFGVGEASVQLLGEEDFRDEYDLRHKDLSNDVREQAEKALEDIGDLMGTLGDEMLRDIFGDPAEVTATAECISVTECETY